MIPWWIFPIICTLGAAGLLQLVSWDSDLPYRSLVVIGMIIIMAPVLAAIWLLCFLISLIHP